MSDKDKEPQKHVHNDLERVAKRTRESVYVKKGSMRVDLYTENLELFEQFVVSGDLAVFAYGGHGYFILEDDTQVIETKNGPFVDVETDKTKFLSALYLSKNKKILLLSQGSQGVHALRELFASRG